MTILDREHLDTAEFRHAGVIGRAFDRMLGFIAKRIDLHRERRRQWIDRAAFLNLLGKEDWVYDDLGIHKADVEWAATLPLHVNASKELERIRAENMQGR